MLTEDQAAKLKNVYSEFSPEGDETGQIFDLFAAMPEQYIIPIDGQENGFFSNVKQDTKRNVWIEQNWGSDKPSFTLFIKPGEFDVAVQLILKKHELDISPIKANLSEEAVRAGSNLESVSFILLLSNRMPKSFIEYHISDLMDERIGLTVFEKAHNDTWPVNVVHGSVTSVMGVKLRTKLDVHALLAKLIFLVLLFGMIGLIAWNFI